MARSRPESPKDRDSAEEVERLHALARGRDRACVCDRSCRLGQLTSCHDPGIAGWAAWMPDGVHDARDEFLMAFEEALAGLCARCTLWTTSGRPLSRGRLARW